MTQTLWMFRFTRHLDSLYPKRPDEHISWTPKTSPRMLCLFPVKEHFSEFVRGRKAAPYERQGNDDQE